MKISVNHKLLSYLNLTIFITNFITVEEVYFFLSKVSQLCSAPFIVENMDKITSGTHLK